MLLDPFEEQFDLPALFVKCANGERGQREIVGQEFERLAGILVDVDHATQHIGIALARYLAGEPDVTVADQSGDRLDPLAAHNFELQIVLGAGDKEGAGAMEEIEPGEVDVSPIHDIERARLDQALRSEHIQHPYIVHLAVADVKEAWDCSAQVDAYAV